MFIKGIAIFLQFILPQSANEIKAKRVAGLKDSSTAGHTALSSSVHARRKREKKSAAKLRVSVFIINGCKMFFIFCGKSNIKRAAIPFCDYGGFQSSIA